jgi:Uma2 family endonuclease
VLHQRISRNLEYRLVQFVREGGLGQVFDSPIDVVLGEGKAREVVQPDIVFLSRDREYFVHDDEIRGAPDLVVEILSPGTEKSDKGYKMRLYARYGVREYWIVEPKARMVEVYTPDGKDPKQRAAAEQVVIFWPNQDGRGVHVNVSGAGVARHAPHRDQAVRLLEFLAGDDAQQWYAEVNYEYPVKPGVPISETLRVWGPFRSDRINLSQLGKLNAEAMKLMDRAGWK